MNFEKRIQALEKQFIYLSDNAHDLVFFIRQGFIEHMPSTDVMEMKKGLLVDMNDIMSADQEYLYLTGNQVSHPNYEKFMTYMKLAKSGLDNELVKKNLRS